MAETNFVDYVKISDDRARAVPALRTCDARNFNQKGGLTVATAEEGETSFLEVIHNSGPFCTLSSESISSPVTEGWAHRIIKPAPTGRMSS